MKKKVSFLKLHMLVITAFLLCASAIPATAKIRTFKDRFGNGVRIGNGQITVFGKPLGFKEPYSVNFKLKGTTPTSTRVTAAALLLPLALATQMKVSIPQLKAKRILLPAIQQTQMAENIKFNSIILSGGYFHYPMRLSDTDLSNADLRNASFSGVDMSKTNLSRANMQKVKVNDYADLKGTHSSSFQGANLSGADLTGSKFWHANFNGANLQHANLKGAKFNAVDLQNVDLRGTDLTKTKFSFSNNWNGAKLEGAKVPSNMKRILSQYKIKGNPIYVD